MPCAWKKRCGIAKEKGGFGLEEVGGRGREYTQRIDGNIEGKTDNGDVISGWPHP